MSWCVFICHLQHFRSTEHFFFFAAAAAQKSFLSLFPFFLVVLFSRQSYIFVCGFKVHPKQNHKLQSLWVTAGEEMKKTLWINKKMKLMSQTEQRRGRQHRFKFPLVLVINNLLYLLHSIFALFWINRPVGDTQPNFPLCSSSMSLTIKADEGASYLPTEAAAAQRRFHERNHNLTPFSRTISKSFWMGGEKKRKKKRSSSPWQKENRNKSKLEKESEVL